jgi:hypothetical protein
MKSAFPTPPRAAALRARLSAHGFNLPDGYVDIARAFLGYRVERLPLTAEWDEAGDDYLAAFGDMPDAPVSAPSAPRAQSFAPDEHTAKLFTATRNFKIGEVRRLTTLRRLRTDVREMFEALGFAIESQTGAELTGVRRLSERFVCAVSVPAIAPEETEPRAAFRDQSATYTFYPDAVLPGMKYYQPSSYELDPLDAADRGAFFALRNLAWIAFFAALLDLTTARTA